MDSTASQTQTAMILVIKKRCDCREIEQVGSHGQVDERQGGGAILPWAWRRIKR
ncbi:hypothetical protein HBI81_173380 [Parastagonospora nodorum]|nr:hypothetical protein HBH95_178860 [Parastagonospora nodorum]KAH5540465.1 hypothetical protein HBI27_106170 [Parastagonospora nodorum]KAH6433476.1 hypothetical protein HBI59_174070 [Parastagonospora nodorum]KAH6518474.1 hypothetical protein HBI81_173380 [Parastagonospora nodorum]